MPRAKSVQIYLKPGLEEDDRLLAFWRACQRNSRPQEVFRRLLNVGFAELIDRGEISPKMLSEIQAELQGHVVDPLDQPARPARRPAAAPEPDSKDPIASGPEEETTEDVADDQVLPEEADPTDDAKDPENPAPDPDPDEEGAASNTGGARTPDSGNEPSDIAQRPAPGRHAFIGDIM
ncbi:hypothetical protein [Salipiger mucosus]|uniref:Uncharacterized protein n=1 Tax=Salipiger mucosus DSM 16094 TaxID=1123237 RepID=S9QES6_9RHOB|nr:hypothetical protein [Salipiger mucosus]EPX78058.1 hypothetical protein Salmuc_03380 [Salipiger mucosus DSM 16094]